MQEYYIRESYAGGGDNDLQGESMDLEPAGKKDFFHPFVRRKNNTEKRFDTDTKKSTKTCNYPYNRPRFQTGVKRGHTHVQIACQNVLPQ